MTEFDIAGQSPGRKTYQNVGLILGPILFALILLLPVPEGMSGEAWKVVALAALMGSWWATEAIPVPATSLIPVVFLPLLEVGSIGEATAPYARPVIFLLLGGFIVAMGMQKWGLHRRIALAVVAAAGGHPAAMIGGFMAASAILSMWISNTATTLMMVPIAISVAETMLGGKINGHKFTIALLIGCAWAASIGGLGTLIGTPPNVFVAGFMEQELGREIAFIDWMLFAVPVVIAMVPVAWFILTQLFFRFEATDITGGQAVIADERAKLGRMTTPEKRVAGVLALMAFTWTFRTLINDLPGMAWLTDTAVAVAGALIMFLIPSGATEPKERNSMLLNWETAVTLPWGVILLFGGGLSLAAAISSTGLAVWLGNAMAVLTTIHLFLMMLVIVGVVVFLTEITSNTATTAALVPVLAAVAVAADIDPILLAAPTAMAASCAFMLPVATGPNAVIFSSGHIRIPDMARAGMALNVIGTFVVATICYALAPWALG